MSKKYISLEHIARIIREDAAEKQFKKLHGSTYDPNSRIDREKMKKIRQDVTEPVKAAEPTTPSSPSTSSVKSTIPTFNLSPEEIGKNYFKTVQPEIPRPSTTAPKPVASPTDTLKQAAPLGKLPTMGTTATKAASSTKGYSDKELYNMIHPHAKKLEGITVPGGEKYGIKTGSQGEWAHYLTQLAKKESSGVATAGGDKGRFGAAAGQSGSHGLFQLSPSDRKNYGLSKENDSIENLHDPEHNIKTAIDIHHARLTNPKNQGQDFQQRIGAYWGPVKRNELKVSEYNPKDYEEQKPVQTAQADTNIEQKESGPKKIKESVGIIGSQHPKFDMSAFKKTAFIRPPRGEEHPGRHAENLAAQRKIAKAKKALPIKMEESDISTFGGDSSAGHNPIASTPETESGKKKKKLREDVLKENPLIGALLGGMLARTAIGSELLGGGLLGTARGASLGYRIGSSLSKKDDDDTDETESGKKKKIKKESGKVPNTFKEETVNRDKKTGRMGVTVIPKTTLGSNERVKQSFDDLGTPVPNQGDAPATSNSPTTSSRESGPKKKIQEDAKDKHNVPRTAAMSTVEKDRKKVQYVDREYDRKGTMSKQARQAAYKTNVIDETKANLHRIMREAIDDAVADSHSKIKNKKIIIKAKTGGETEVDFHPNLNKPNPDVRMNEDSMLPSDAQITSNLEATKRRAAAVKQQQQSNITKTKEMEAKYQKGEISADELEKHYKGSTGQVATMAPAVKVAKDVEKTTPEKAIGMARGAETVADFSPLVTHQLALGALKYGQGDTSGAMENIAGAAGAKLIGPAFRKAKFLYGKITGKVSGAGSNIAGATAAGAAAAAPSMLAPSVASAATDNKEPEKQSGSTPPEQKTTPPSGSTPPEQKTTPPSGSTPPEQKTTPPSGSTPPAKPAVNVPKGEGELGTRLAGLGISREQRRNQEFVDKTLGTGKFTAGSAASNYALEKAMKEKQPETKTPSQPEPEEKESGPKRKKVSESTIIEAYLQRFAKNK